MPEWPQKHKFHNNIRTLLGLSSTTASKFMALADMNILLIEVYYYKYMLLLPSSLQKGVPYHVLASNEVWGKELGR